MVCDLSIAAETAKLGQAGPKVGSSTPVTALAYCSGVGLKKAKEIWYMCRLYTAKEALDMGLVNAVVPYEQLDKEVDKWCADLLEKSPTALKCQVCFSRRNRWCRRNHPSGCWRPSRLSGSDESVEGKNAFMENGKAGLCQVPEIKFLVAVFGKAAEDWKAVALSLP